MNAQDFAYWLNGFVELGGEKTPPTPEQWKLIVEHLKLTMKKVTPALTVTPVKTDPNEWVKKALEEFDRKLDKKADRFVNPGVPSIVPPPYQPQFEPGLPGPLPDWNKWPWDNSQPVILC